jgi:hypothetical protein
MEPVEPRIDIFLFFITYDNYKYKQPHNARQVIIDSSPEFEHALRSLLSLA